MNQITVFQPEYRGNSLLGRNCRLAGMFRPDSQIGNAFKAQAVADFILTIGKDDFGIRPDGGNQSLFPVFRGKPDSLPGQFVQRFQWQIIGFGVTFRETPRVTTDRDGRIVIIIESLG